MVAFEFAALSALASEVATGAEGVAASGAVGAAFAAKLDAPRVNAQPTAKTRLCRRLLAMPKNLMLEKMVMYL